MSAMDNTSTTQPTNPSSSSNEAIEDGSRTVTATSSTSSSSSYCPDCPICNPPDGKSSNASAYGTIEPLSYDQPPEPTFLESTVEACAELCCCICDSPPPSIRTSDWSSTTYPSSISSNSYSYSGTETGSSQSQTSDAETVHTHAHRHSDGYKRQQEMRPSVQDPQSLSSNLSNNSVTHSGEKKKSYSIA
ncbi:hypothetical protein CI102_565 [Trichoderma harzianum]|nr:hypothetical protein CI102_565 [Trichoderma harzianum]